MLPGEEVSLGYVVCRLGTDRLAFRAEEVALIEASRRAPLDRSGHATTLRLLRSADGGSVDVEEVQVVGEHLPHLRAPAMLRHVAGGAVSAFVIFQGAVLPLMSMERFVRFLGAQREGKP